MAVEPPGDILAGLIEATIGGTLGRLLHYILTGRTPPRWVAALWEMPACVALGFIGLGVADYLGVHGWPAFAIIIVSGFGGVKVLNVIIEIAAKGKK